MGVPLKAELKKRMAGKAEWRNTPIPVHSKSDKIPYLPHWQAHRWILLHALWPLAIHQAWVSLLGYPLPFPLAVLLYTFSYAVNGLRVLTVMDKMTHMYGCLDGDVHARDDMTFNDLFPWYIQIPISFSRPVMMLSLAYHYDAPLDISPWVIVEIAVYPIILDFYFYWYHRIMHEVEGLWQFHKRHHTTKHPNAMLAVYADYEQVLNDIVVVPLVTWTTMRAIGLPMGFYEWFMCMSYVSFVELMGHSGLRLYATPPSPISWLLEWFDAELVIEDHDMHHRRGWKKASNYGKQTRVWDRLFGTCGVRLESVPENIDWEHPAVVPLT